MTIAYILPAFNEQKIIRASIERILKQFGQGVMVVVSINGSTDQTESTVRSMAKTDERIQVVVTDQKGMGIAYRLGIRRVMDLFKTQPVTIVLSASDLPFGFSDLRGLPLPEGEIWVGSKAHKESETDSRSFFRGTLTRVFWVIKSVFLRVRTVDTQGTVIGSSQLISGLAEKVINNEFFFSTEIIFRAEKSGINVVEKPIVLEPEQRNSSVQVFRFALKMLYWALTLK